MERPLDRNQGMVIFNKLLNIDCSRLLARHCEERSNLFHFRLLCRYAPRNDDTLLGFARLKQQPFVIASETKQSLSYYLDVLPYFQLIRLLCRYAPRNDDAIYELITLKK